MQQQLSLCQSLAGLTALPHKGRLRKRCSSRSGPVEHECARERESERQR